MTLHGRCRNRERDADAAAGRRIDRGVDADHVAFGVERRTTRIALVHGRVDLDEIVIGTVADVAAHGRDDAGGHRAAEAEGIADREHPVADARLAVRQLGKREVRAALDLDQREVGARVGADHLGGVGLAVIGRDFDLAGAVDDVVVGDGIAVGGNEEAGALAHDRRDCRRGRPRMPGGSPSGPPKRRKKRSIGEPGWNGSIIVVAVVALGDLLVDIDLHRNHRRLHALDDVGETDRLLDLAHLVGDLRMRRGGEHVHRAARRAEAIDGDAEAGDNGRHQRELAGGEQRTARLPVGREGRKIDRTVGHQVISKA